MSSRVGSLEGSDKSRWEKVRVDYRERRAVDLARLTLCILSAHEGNLIHCSLSIIQQFFIAVNMGNTWTTNIQLRFMSVFPHTVNTSMGKSTAHSFIGRVCYPQWRRRVYTSNLQRAVYSLKCNKLVKCSIKKLLS